MVFLMLTEYVIYIFCCMSCFVSNVLLKKIQCVLSVCVCLLYRVSQSALAVH